MFSMLFSIVLIDSAALHSLPHPEVHDYMSLDFREYEILDTLEKYRKM